MVLVTAKQISATYSIPPSTLYYYIYKGAIPYIRIQGRIKFDKEIIADWVRKQNGDNANKKVW